MHWQAGAYTAGKDYVVDDLSHEFSDYGLPSDNLLQAHCRATSPTIDRSRSADISRGGTEPRSRTASTSAPRDEFTFRVRDFAACLEPPRVRDFAACLEPPRPPRLSVYRRHGSRCAATDFAAFGFRLAGTDGNFLRPHSVNA
ncbi:MAG: hypothetical protein QOI01_1688 [Mycobacterium sp.]|jgi:hypothetical protein|nr:hypothetical protein [Mycobacterium sp.]